MEPMRYDFMIPANHPALVDHFPGNPLVPGALLLDHVLLGCELFAAEDFHSAALKEIKFKSPLRGHELAHVTYSQSPMGLRFKVEVDDREVASGILSLQHSPKD
jgi:3-hydroxymyristoyl/3-hydroxydecanoyl-(acyl carrier protein) dehydratase